MNKKKNGSSGPSKISVAVFMALLICGVVSFIGLLLSGGKVETASTGSTEVSDARAMTRDLVTVKSVGADDIVSESSDTNGSSVGNRLEKIGYTIEGGSPIGFSDM